METIMTWGQFKAAVEGCNVKDDDELGTINDLSIDPNELHIQISASTHVVDIWTGLELK